MACVGLLGSGDRTSQELGQGAALALEGHWPGAAQSAATHSGCLPVQVERQPHPKDPRMPWGGNRGDGPWSHMSLPVTMEPSNHQVLAAALSLEVETENPTCASLVASGKDVGW